jgi:hypothetical protein
MPDAGAGAASLFSGKKQAGSLGGLFFRFTINDRFAVYASRAFRAGRTLPGTYASGIGNNFPKYFPCVILHDVILLSRHEQEHFKHK